jgi:hypothetical protein
LAARCIASQIVYIEFAIRPSSICGREIENEEKKLTLSECIRRKERKMPLRLVILFANFYRGRQRESFAWGGGEERGGRESVGLKKLLCTQQLYKYSTNADK